MTNTLYRKYRPQSFSELVGQNHIKITLQNEIESDRIAHAYLFFGPRGIGKTTTARLLAKALNCEKRQKGESEPCNECPACQEVIDGRSLDLVEVDAASHTGVDNVRENIIANSRIAPTKRKHKVFIIDEVHMLSVSAFNALLKTLEEPPEQVIFILATTEVHRVPETIVSRCQRFDFKKVSQDEITTRLNDFCQKEKVKVEEKVLKHIAQNASGSMRDAESMLGQVIALGEKDITEDVASLVLPKSDISEVMLLIKHLVDKSSRESIELVGRLSEEGAQLDQFTKTVIEFLRQMLLAKVKEQSNIFEQFTLSDKDQQAEVTRLLEMVDVPQVMRWINVFLAAQEGLKEELTIHQLPLELAVLEICEGTDLKPQSDSGTGQSASLKIAQQQDPALDKKKSDKVGAIKKVISKARDKKKEIISVKARKDKKSQQLVSAEELKEKWPTVLKELKKYNHSLTLTLSVSEIVSVESNILTLGFAYKFYQDRVWEKKNKDTVEKVLKEVYDTKISLKCVTDENLREKLAEKAGAAATPKEDVVNAALDAFGGEVVENNS